MGNKIQSFLRIYIFSAFWRIVYKRALFDTPFFALSPYKKGPGQGGGGCVGKKNLRTNSYDDKYFSRFIFFFLREFNVAQNVNKRLSDFALIVHTLALPYIV